MIFVCAAELTQIAQTATAIGSSAYNSALSAIQTIDGDVETRWTSAPGDDNGAWMKLTWLLPVRINQVNIKWDYHLVHQCSLLTLEWDSGDTFQVS